MLDPKRARSKIIPTQMEVSFLSQGTASIQRWYRRR